MKIAIDAMGGDNAPKEIIEGVKQALEAFSDVEILLYGQQDKIDEYIKPQDHLTIIHCAEVIESEDDPVRSVRRKKDASMVRMAEAVKEGTADAAVSAGNTGALMSAGLFIVGRIDGVDRPALAPTLPTMDGKGFLMLDLGANADAKPEHLVQYAIMGSIYAEKVRGVQNPTVGLLNIGTEEKKGNELTKAAFPLLKEAPVNFIGNVESRDLLNGAADVVVTDGFTGNMVLKTIEGTAMNVFAMIKDVFMASTKTKIAAMLVKNDLSALKGMLDYSEYGGAGLFGLKAPVIKAHGSSNGTAFYNAIRQARTMVEHDVAGKIYSTLKEEQSS
ncbi:MULTISPECIES: phosphate acyltransferase PlsX [unclassified Planococcus (in: firmicutes)]|uniref:phosphate acyltransferase PlsX n=1 Tax=unclassified Planococcus (in: firmicutes) TaxID=2662419 RepID=UPI000C32B1FF|nr:MULTISPECIES: phosphate acyltransferase PlsX [unclassified Planococcus (in: firmicutes)]AUD14117.1 phosphate acyltransferase PlsX [Planococcus sp. MB-3u-03]PKG48139.1 phosphate acyltransferase PlsX [Planococcus sp. Urea-trap-24]PKG91987.1 phosphate acyltransferase PlsX [Planococcus sp. Urea-3u-39]PKH43109.1 phosphate acyltransferase PlsX [Planococcus sp. MB-3u-09]